LQSDFNYRERGMNTLCFLPEIVTEFSPQIRSRIGLFKDPIILTTGMDIEKYIASHHSQYALSCIFVDEAQFLSKDHVSQLCRVVDHMNIPVLTYGLRTDFRGDLFEGSQHLLALADQIEEIKTICFCGRKAIMTARMTKEGAAVTGGDQVDCGGNDKYISLCRKHHGMFSGGQKLSQLQQEACI
jgi:thymidine kinase